MIFASFFIYSYLGKFGFEDADDVIIGLHVADFFGLQSYVELSFMFYVEIQLAHRVPLLTGGLGTGVIYGVLLKEILQDF